MNLRDALLQTAPSKPSYQTVSTGLTLLNLLLTRTKTGGICSGSVVLVSGSPCSGRTTFGVSLLAEADHNPSFSDYGLVYYDDLLHGSLSYGYIDLGYVDRLSHRSLDTVDGFWDDIESLPRSIIVLDSLDVLMALNPSSEVVAWKTNNNRVRRAFTGIRSKGSIFIMMAREKKICDKIVSAGGSAIPTYADYWFRTHNCGPIFQTTNGRERLVGTRSSITVIKAPNSKLGVSIPAPIYSYSGYDDIESVIRFLIRERRIIKTEEGYKFGVESFPSMDSLIDHAESNRSEWVDYAELWVKNGLGGGKRTDDISRGTGIRGEI